MTWIVLCMPRPLARESASPTHGNLWPYCERCSSGRSKGAPWAWQGSRVISQCRELQQSASCANSKSADLFHATGGGSSFLVKVLNQPRMVETLERLILMIHKASAKLPKTGLNEANGN